MTIKNMIKKINNSINPIFSNNKDIQKTKMNIAIEYKRVKRALTKSELRGLIGLLTYKG